MKYTILILIIILTSCRLNLSVRRLIDIDKGRLEVTTTAFLNKIKSQSDTILFIESSNCHPYDEAFKIVTYKVHGVTFSKVFSSEAEYKTIPRIENFNWDTLINSIDSVLIQKPKPSYWASVIEGDTVWKRSGEFSGETAWGIKLILNKRELEWETVAHERHNNPSMVKSKISDYIFTETYNKIWGTSHFFGKPKYRLLPVLGRRKST